MPIKAPDIPIWEHEGLDTRTRWELMVADIKREVTSGEREGQAVPPTRAWAVTSLLRKLASKQTRFADLHVHTRISDGWISPGDAVERAARVGLAAIAIADHDSISGIQTALWAGRQFGVEVIPAVEVSSGIDNRELHILGYYIDWRDKKFAEKLLEIQEFRKERVKLIVDKLRELNIDIPYNVVIALDGGVVGRPHIAQAMVDLGYVRTTDEAFDKYLGVGKPAYVSKYPLTPHKAIALIRKVGGIPVLAHPLFARADDLLPELIEAGLRGLEVYHTKHDASVTKHYEELARKYDLLMVGGSDSHGVGEVPIGHVRVPYSFVEKLREELAAMGAARGATTNSMLAARVKAHERGRAANFKAVKTR